MPSTKNVWFIEITNQDGTKERGFYTARKALYLDNYEIIPASLETLNRWDWEKEWQKDNVLIVKAEAYTTPDVEEFNWIDQLPPDIGAEHTDIED